MSLASQISALATRVGVEFKAVRAVASVVASFEASKAANQTGIAAATWTKVTFPTEVADVGSIYDNANSRVTPPAGRPFIISAGISLLDGTTSNPLYLAIYKNGAIWQNIAMMASILGADASVEGQAIIQNPNGTDYYEVWVYTAGGTTHAIISTPAWVYFKGTQVVGASYPVGPTADNSSFLAVPTGSLLDKTGDGTVYDVIFGTEIFDAGNEYNPATGVFTANATGKYLLSVALMLNNIAAGHTFYSLDLITSNRTYQYRQKPQVDANSQGSLALTVLADMDAGDTAKVRITVSGSTKVVDIVQSTAESFFSGVRVPAVGLNTGFSGQFADLLGKPTTLAGYGIPDPGPAYFAANKTADQTGIATNTFTKVTWPTASLNVGPAGAIYDTSNSRVYPPAGKPFLLDWQVAISTAPAAGRVFIGLYRNGSLYNWANDYYTAAAGEHYFSGMAVIPAPNGTDYWELFFYIIGGSNHTIMSGSDRCWFRGAQLSGGLGSVMGGGGGGGAFSDLTGKPTTIAGYGITDSSTILRYSGAWDPGSVINNNKTTTDVTVTGAAVGDIATADFSLMVDGWWITARVISANTVRVYLWNNTGATSDLASGTLKVQVSK